MAKRSDRMNTRWRRNQERIPTPPSTNARIPSTREENDVWIEIERSEAEFPPRIAALVHDEIIVEVQPTHPSREVTVEFNESSTRVQARATSRPTGYWKLRNGKFIAISEMDDEHLQNCISMCERNSNARGRRADSSGPGVYSELCHERERRRLRLIEHSEMLRRERELETVRRRYELDVQERNRLRHEAQERFRRNRPEWHFLWTEREATPPSEPEVLPELEPESLAPAPEAPKRRIKL